MNISKTVEWELKDNIGILTINNPPQNLLEEPDFLDIEKLKDLMNDNLVKGLIITGKAKHFSAGAVKENIYRDAQNDGSFEEKLKVSVILIISTTGLIITSITQ